MKRLTYILAAGITVAGLSGCEDAGTVSFEPGEPIVNPDQMAQIIETLKSDQALANRFGVNSCLQLGPAAAEALPFLVELRAKTTDTEYMGRIDAAIAAIEGDGDAAVTPPDG